jgi:hypothetical protein
MTMDNMWLTSEDLAKRWNLEPRTARERAVRHGARSQRTGTSGETGGYRFFSPDIDEIDAKKFGADGKVLRQTPMPGEKPPAAESEGVQKAKEAAEIAEAKRREMEALVQAGALIHRELEIDPKRPIESFLEQVEARTKELDAERAAVEASKQERDEILAREETSKQLLAEAQAKREEATQFAKDVNAKASEWLQGIIENWKRGSLGLLEEILWWCTNSVVTRAEVHWVCDDCQKADAKLRGATFSPRLADISPNFGLCADCEPGSQERFDRINSLTLCDACPIKTSILEQIRQLCEDIIESQGGKIYEQKDGRLELCEGVYDESGQYKKGSAFRERAESADVATLLLRDLVRQRSGESQPGNTDA